MQPLAAYGDLDACLAAANEVRERAGGGYVLTAHSWALSTRIGCRAEDGVIVWRHVFLALWVVGGPGAGGWFEEYLGSGISGSWLMMGWWGSWRWVVNVIDDVL